MQDIAEMNMCSLNYLLTITHTFCHLVWLRLLPVIISPFQMQLPAIQIRLELLSRGSSPHFSRDGTMSMVNVKLSNAGEWLTFVIHCTDGSELENKSHYLRDGNYRPKVLN